MASRQVVSLAGLPHALTRALSRRVFPRRRQALAGSLALCCVRLTSASDAPRASARSSRAPVVPGPIGREVQPVLVRRELERLQRQRQQRGDLALLELGLAVRRAASPPSERPRRLEIRAQHRGHATDGERDLPRKPVNAPTHEEAVVPPRERQAHSGRPPCLRWYRRCCCAISSARRGCPWFIVSSSRRISSIFCESASWSSPSSGRSSPT